MFTANEAVTAIANRPSEDADFEDRFERAAFAEYLAEMYGASQHTTAADFVDELCSSHTMFEGDRVRHWFAELMLFRCE